MFLTLVIRHETPLQTRLPAGRAKDNDSCMNDLEKLLRQGLLWGSLVACLACVACSPAPDSGPSSAAAASAPVALSVDVVRATWREVPEWLEVSGNVAPRETVSVSTELGGMRIARFHAQVGDAVQQGQLLAVLDDSLLRSELAQLQAAADEAKIALSTAQQQLSRAKELADQGMVSQQALLNAQAAEGAAQARLRQQQAGMAGLHQRMSRARVTAPAAGVITARQGIQGSVVASGQDIFRLTRHAELEWQAEVPAQSVHRLQVGGEVQLLADNQTELRGQVTRIGPVVDPNHRRIVVYVALQPSEAVRPGNFLKGRMALGTQQAWWLPTTAVVLRGDAAWVLSVDAQGLVQELRVQVLRTLDRDSAVTGLEGNLDVVAQGAPYLSQGDRVHVVSRMAPPAAVASRPQALRGLTLEP